MSRVTGQFAEYLSENQEYCNMRFALLGGRVLPETAYDVLSELVQPIVNKASPEQVDFLAKELVNASYTLMGKGLLGRSTRIPQIMLLWTDVFPRLIPFLQMNPNQVIVSMTNAVYWLAQHAPAGAEKWMKRIVELNPLYQSTEDLLQVGQVLAWVCGLSKYRASAILVWHDLSPKIRAAILGSESASFENFWVHPSSSSAPKRLAVCGRVGGHIELGGCFSSQPLVAEVDGKILAFDSKGYFIIHADCFGQQLTPHSTEPETLNESLPSHIKVQKNGGIHWGDTELKQPALSDASSVAFASQTLAVTVPHSFYVTLITLLPE